MAAVAPGMCQRPNKRTHRSWDHRRRPPCCLLPNTAKLLGRHRLGAPLRLCLSAGWTPARAPLSRSPHPMGVQHAVLSVALSGGSMCPPHLRSCNPWEALGHPRKTQDAFVHLTGNQHLGCLWQAGQLGSTPWLSAAPALGFPVFQCHSTFRAGWPPSLWTTLEPAQRQCPHLCSQQARCPSPPPPWSPRASRSPFASRTPMAFRLLEPRQWRCLWTRVGSRCQTTPQLTSASH
mmetsp:Transcript_23899/g.66323  ORF Transcript_23899/g.66323 Transcript_23899/m.66323 type:complete len:234 (-) Transcript_23899:2198-2899(-)